MEVLMRLQNPKLVSTIFVCSIIFSLLLSGCGLDRIVKNLSGENQVGSLVVFQSGVRSRCLNGEAQTFIAMPNVWLVESIDGETFEEPYCLMVTPIEEGPEDMAPDQIEKLYSPSDYSKSEIVAGNYSKVLESGKMSFATSQLSYVVGIQSEDLHKPVLEGMCRSKSTGKLLEVTLAKGTDREKDPKKLAFSDRLRHIILDIK